MKRSVLASLGALLLLCAFFVNSSQAGPILAVSGTVTKADGSLAGDGLKVTIVDETVNARATATTGDLVATSQYSGTLFVLAIPDIQEGDLLTVTVKDTSGAVVGKVQRPLTAQEVAESKATINVVLSGLVVSLDKPSVAADGKSPVGISVQVLGQDGQPITDDTLTLTSALGATITDAVHTENGIYTATYTAPLVDDPSDTITVASAKLGTTATANVTLQKVPTDVKASVANASLVADGSSTTTVTVQITKGDTPIADETVSVNTAGLKGTVSEFTNEGGGIYKAMYTAGTVAGPDTIRIQTTKSGAKSVVVTLTPGPVANVSVVATPSSVLGNGAAQSFLSISVTDANDNPISGKQVTAEVDGAGTVGAVADKGDGTYTAIYTAPVATEAGSEVVRATADGVSGEATIDLTLEPPAESFALKVTGAVYLEDGATNAPVGLSVKVTNQTKLALTNLQPLTTPTALLNGHIGYDVTFLDFSGGQVVATTGDAIQIEIEDANGTVGIQTSLPHILTSDEVNTGVVQIDITTDLKAQAPAMKITGRVFLEDAQAVAGPGIDVKLTNLSTGQTTSGITKVLDGHVGYDVTLINPTTGAMVATGGDLIQFELSENGQPVGILSANPVALTTGQVAAGFAEIDLTSDKTASSPALKVKGQVFLDDGRSNAGPGVAYTITNLTKQQSIGLGGLSGVTHRLNGVVGFDETFIDVNAGAIVADTGDEILVELTKDGAPVAVLSPMPVVLTSSWVAAGAAEFNVTANLLAESVALQIVGTVLDETGAPAPAGLALRAENVTSGASATSVTTAGSFSATLLDIQTGGVVARTGDRIEITVSDAGVLRGFTAATLGTTEVAQGSVTGLTVQFASEATDVAVTPAAAELVADGKSTTDLTISLHDVNNVPVAGDTITAVPTVGTVGDVIDNGNGTYTVTYTSGTQAIPALITVTASSGAAGTAQIDLVPGPVASATVATDKDTLDADGESTAQITVTLADANGNRVAGDTVTVVATTGTVGDVTDNGDGTYTATYTASKQPILALVTATAASNGTTGFVEIQLRDNVPPVAVAGEDQVVQIGQEVTLDGSGSTDNIEIVSYSWDFNTADDVTVDAETAIATAIYDLPGAYTAQLTVTDVGGNTATDEVQIIAGGLLIQGVVLEADGTPLRAQAEGAVRVRITIELSGGAAAMTSSRKAQAGDRLQVLVPVVNGTYQAVFTSDQADLMVDGDAVLVEVVGVANPDQQFAPPVNLSLSTAVLAAASLPVEDIQTDRTSTFTVSGILTNADGNPVGGAVVSLGTAVPRTTKSDGSYSIVLDDFATNPVEGERLLLTVQIGDKKVRKQIVAQLDNRGVVLDVAFTPMRVGGLAVNTKRYFDIIDEAMNSLIDSAGEGGLLSRTDIFLLKSIDLPQLLLGGFLPAIYPEQGERAYPELFENMENMDLENFGNAILPSPLSAITQGAFVANAGLPVALAGNKLDLYLLAPSDVSQVSFRLNGDQAVLGTATQVTADDPVLVDHPFQLEEEMALLFLPSWPGMDPTDPNPPTVLDSVTLYYAASPEGSAPPADRSAYTGVGMNPDVIDNKRVWTATPLLDAGKSYNYFYEVKLKNPISVLGVGDVLLNTQTWVLPDPRNLQIEDRGLIKRILQAASPVTNQIIAEFGPVIATGGAFDQQAILDRFMNDLISAVTPEIQAIVTDIVTTGDPHIVSRLTAPAVPADGSMWVGSFNLDGVEDGVYEVVIEAMDDAGNVLDQISGKQLILDRFAYPKSGVRKVDLSIAPKRDAAVYQRSDGIYVGAVSPDPGSAQTTPIGTLTLTASPQLTPGHFYLFQMLQYEEDPAIQAKRPWVPVNTMALPLLILRVADEDLYRQFQANPSADLFGQIVTAVAGMDPVDFAQALKDADPEGVDALLQALQGSAGDDLNQLIQVISDLVSDPTAIDPASLIAIFPSLQQLLGLLGQLNINPLQFGRSSVDAVIGDFITGDYWLRAVPFDPVLNMETGDAPALRLRLVQPVADVVSINTASIGDQNGDGDTEDAFESGVAEGFQLFSNVTEVTLTASFVTRTEHPVTLSFEYALASSPDQWVVIDTQSLGEDEGATGDELTVTWKADFGSLAGDADQVFVRVVATNAIKMVDAQQVTMSLSDRPVPTEPEVVFFTTEVLTTNPDSGGPTGVVNLNAFTRTETITPIDKVVFEYFNGTDWVAIGELAAPTDEDVASADVDIIQSAVEQLLLGGGEVKLDSTYDQWTLAWDTTTVDDTITGDEPAARDATLDDNPYPVRAYTVSESVSQTGPPEQTVSVDNVDDVAPLTGTTITAVEVQDDDGNPIAAELVDGVYQVDSLVTIFAQPAAAAGTFSGVRLYVYDEAGNQVAGPIDLAVDGDTYSVQVNSKDLPNGAYSLQMLAVDEAGNEEVADPALAVAVNIANIVDGGDQELEISDINIVLTGALDLAAEPRPLSLPADLRPIASSTSFVASVKNAKHADLLISGQAGAIPGVAVDGGFSFDVDASTLADGSYIFSFRFFASPPVVIDVPVVVDNTPPVTAFMAPLAGTRVGPLPSLWASLADAGSGVFIVNLTNSAPGVTPVDLTAAGRIEGTDAGAQLIPPTEADDEPVFTVLDDRVTYDPADALAPGGYTATVTVTDLAGNVAQATTSYIVERDTTPPVITFVTPQGTVLSQQPKLSVSFTDASPLSTATFAIDSGAAVDATELSRTVVSYTPDNPLDEGEHTVTVALTDAFDNSASFSWSFIVELPPPDTEQPVITATSPQGTVRIDNPQVIATASDDAGLTDLKVSLSLATAAGTAIGSAVETTGTGKAVIKTSGLAAGSYVASVTATDAAGNSTAAEWTFIVELQPKNTVPPVFTATSPQGTVYTATPRIVASASDDSGKAPTVSVTLRDSTGASKGSKSGSGTATLDAPKLADGAYTVEATATDGDQNKATATWVFYVKLDTVPPVFTGTSPVGIVRTEDVDVVASATDDSGDAPKVTVTFAGQKKTGNGQATVSATGLDAGTYTATATAKDAAGNEAKTQWTFTIELDSIPPAIQAIGPHGIIREEKPTVSVTATDDISGVASIDIKLSTGGKNVAGKTTADKEKSSATFKPGSALKAGVYSVDVTAKDVAGNTGTAEWSFTVEFDTEPPVITIVTPGDGARMLERKPAIAASYTDNLSGVDITKVTLSLTGPDGTVKDVTGESTITMSQVRYTPATDLEIGVNTLELSVSDKDGNEAVLKWSFVVETELGIMKARNYPNPFVTTTTVAFTLPRQAEVTIKIYDSSMRLVRTLADREIMEAGPQTIEWDAKLDNDAGDEVARGLYFCQIVMKSELKPEQTVIKMVRRSE